MSSTSITSCDCNRSRCRRLRQVVCNESETNCINIKNANVVQYFESLESFDPGSESESEAIQTQSLSTEISEPERTTTIASNKRILTILQLRFHLSFLQSRTIFIFIFLFFFRFLFLQWEWRSLLGLLLLGFEKFFNSINAAVQPQDKNWSLHSYCTNPPFE